MEQQHEKLIRETKEKHGVEDGTKDLHLWMYYFYLDMFLKQDANKEKEAKQVINKPSP